MKAMTAVALAVCAAALATGFARADGAAAYTDPAGDSNGAIDITKVVVTHSDAAGTVSIGVIFDGAVPAATNFVTVAIDTDRDASTGAQPGGVEVRLEVHNAAWDALRWDGAAFTSIRTTATQPIAFATTPGGYYWTIAKADLGVTTGFAFSVSASGIVSSKSGSHGIGPDKAPDTGAWVYDLVAAPTPTTTAVTTVPSPPPRPLIGPPTATPPRPLAGRRFAVSFRVTRSDTGASLTAGTMVCDPVVGTKTVPHTDSFRDGRARLSFTVPRTAKGKLVTVRVTIRLGTESARRTATFRVSR